MKIVDKVNSHFSSLYEYNFGIFDLLFEPLQKFYKPKVHNILYALKVFLVQFKMIQLRVQPSSLYLSFVIKQSDFLLIRFIFAPEVVTPSVCCVKHDMNPRGILLPVLYDWALHGSATHFSIFIADPTYSTKS